MLEGKKIVRVRAMTDAELKAMYWSRSRFDPEPVVIELDDGTSLYASMDIEGNGPGHIFGTNAQGEDFVLIVKRKEQ